MALGKRHGRNQHSKREDSEHVRTPAGRNSDIAAKAVGWSGRQYEKA